MNYMLFLFATLSAFVGWVWWEMLTERYGSPRR